jgi:hypothetical protein
MIVQWEDATETQKVRLWKLFKKKKKKKYAKEEHSNTTDKQLKSTSSLYYGLLILTVVLPIILQYLVTFDWKDLF